VGSSRRLLAAFAALAATVVPVSPAAQAASPRTLAKFVAASGLGGTSSVSVVRVDGTAVYEWKGAQPRVPASNEKLVTAVAALAQLHASLRMHTAVATVGEPSGTGVVHGSLYLVGGGDPTFTAADIRRLARAVRASGVRRVTGNIVGDESLWDTRRDAPGWKSGFLGEECAPLSALTYARNRSGRSATRAAAALYRALRTAGVKVTGGMRRGRAPAGAALIAVDASPRIDTMLRAMGKNSDNFTAEMLLKAVGASAYGRGTTAGGTRRARQALRDLGLDLTGSRVVDGSGLSSSDRTTTGLLARLLAAAGRTPALAAPLRRSLSIAGRDGTLKNRMTTGPARGVVRAKTGTLNISSALSGYAGPYAFSIIVNGRSVDHAAAHRLQDRIAQYLAREA
jgi:D-alanyl-D-alanine carboxypeptidase/D-alanyl-D-alanine-endopeptidase (penicillin-binding protein 4)